MLTFTCICINLNLNYISNVCLREGNILACKQPGPITCVIEYKLSQKSSSNGVYIITKVYNV